MVNETWHAITFPILFRNLKLTKFPWSTTSDAPILSAKFLNNTMVKAKSKMLEKLVKFWEMDAEGLELSVSCMEKVKML